MAGWLLLVPIARRLRAYEGDGMEAGRWDVSGRTHQSMSLQTTPPEILSSPSSPTQTSALWRSSPQRSPRSQSHLFQTISVRAEWTEAKVESLLRCLGEKFSLLKPVRNLEVEIFDTTQGIANAANRLAVMSLFSQEDHGSSLGFISLTANKRPLLLHRNETEQPLDLFAAVIRLLKAQSSTLRALHLCRLPFPVLLLLL